MVVLDEHGAKAAAAERKGRQDVQLGAFRAEAEKVDVQRKAALVEDLGQRVRVTFLVTAPATL